LAKLSKLKQEAYLAGKKRNWEEAIGIYEQILEIDADNPTPVNELGDICLKTGDIQHAIGHFLRAARKYSKTGLQNNAVAIYKKVLRHDPDNWNAHWFLCKLRAEQGLVVEGREHAEQFLAANANNSPEFKEILLKRCQEMMSLYQSCVPVLQRIAEVYGMWNVPLERARCLCLIACDRFVSGHKDEANELTASALETAPDVVNYAEYARWRQLADPTGDAAPVADVNTVVLSAPEPSAETLAVPDVEPSTLDAVPESGAPAVAPPSAPAPAATTEAAEPTSDAALFGDLEFDDNIASSSPTTAPAPAAEQPVASATSPSGGDETGDETFFGFSLDDDQAGPPADEPAATTPDVDPSVATSDDSTTQVDDDGCFCIDLDEDKSLDDVLSAAASAIDVATGDAMTSPKLAAAVTSTGAEDSETQKPVDLLAEMLAEEETSDADRDAGQIDTIASEIGEQVGGDQPDGPDKLYEMGVVYLEMGMYEPAAESFAAAADDREFAIRSLEMWGITLMRAGDHQQAVAVLGRGLEVPDVRDDERIGLLYHIGRAYEEGEQLSVAREFFEQVAAINSSFLDVKERLQRMTVAVN